MKKIDTSCRRLDAVLDRIVGWSFEGSDFHAVFRLFAGQRGQPITISFVLMALLAGNLYAAKPRLLVGEGVVDISPPHGTALGGFHYSDPTRPRVTTSIHYPPEVRSIVISYGQVTAVIISFDMLNVSFEMVRDVQNRIGNAFKISPQNIRICATHAHSMPSIAFNRHWGDNNPEYEAAVANAMVKASKLARADQTPTRLFVGKARAAGANVNRTVREGARADIEFTEKSNEQDRWFDQTVHVLHFERAEAKPNLLWYNFSAHPVTYGASSAAGPGWPGLVQRLLRGQFDVSPSYLQGHIGDINPVGREQTATMVAGAIVEAVESAVEEPVEQLAVETQLVELPFDMDLFQKNREIHQGKLAANTGISLFDQDWYDTFASQYNLGKSSLPITLAAIRLGDVALLFHPAELYTVYGLEIQRDSPFRQTLVVGYADGYVGYVPDAKAYDRSEYAAAKVPRILNYPPFQPAVGRVMTSSAVELLKRVHRR